jgi:outer membrane protein assembly factor BamE
MTAIARAIFISMLALGTAATAGGCVYRPNIQQGNLLKVEDVDQVTTGMTRSQVRYLLGTPMLGDPFDPQRWDYIYTLHRGHSSKYDRAHFVVRFTGDTVSKVEKLDLPEDVPMNAKKKKKEVLKEASPGAVPAPPPTEGPPAPNDPGTGGSGQ